MKVGQKYKILGEIRVIDESKKQVWLPGTILTVKEKRNGYFTLKEKDSDILALPLTLKETKKWGRNWLQKVG